MSSSEQKPLPMTEWLSVMLGEIERKSAEERAAILERERRAAAGELPQAEDPRYPSR